MPKFGFESEWQEGAAELTERLHTAGLVGDDQMHGYHCRCNNCHFDSPYPLRVQRDSSCAGEIISSPFTSFERATEVMDALQVNAVEVDAVPGYNAGFHVHVDMNEASLNTKANVMFAFALWEPFITDIAKGRFPMIRSMNTPVSTNLRSYIYDYNNWRPAANELTDAYSWYHGRDRHSNLNVRTGYGTFEFRIWNSTRSAWRMELFTRLSVALANRRVAAALIEDRPTMTQDRFGQFRNVLTDNNIERFKTALRAGRQGTTIDLLDRQLNFISGGRATDQEFTAA